MQYDFSKLDKKTIAKGCACKNLDEFRKYLKKNNIDVPEDQIEKLFDAMAFSTHALSDETLDKVAGGVNITLEDGLDGDEIEELIRRARNGDDEADNLLYFYCNNAWCSIHPGK